jgi:hypothetical protein
MRSPVFYKSYGTLEFLQLEKGNMQHLNVREKGFYWRVAFVRRRCTIMTVTVEAQVGINVHRFL